MTSIDTAATTIQRPDPDFAVDLPISPRQRS